MRFILIIVLLTIFGFSSSGQDKLLIASFSIINEDTFFITDVPEVSVLAFKDKEEQKKYFILKRRVLKVYPFAISAKKELLSI